MYKSVLFPVLSSLDAESTHDKALTLLHWAGKSALIRNLIKRRLSHEDPRLKVSVFGLEFPNPIGLAAGFDKNAAAISGLAALGFGHIEIGTVVPLPQTGNPRPRLFRLIDDQALINRMGFNSLGAGVVQENLQKTPVTEVIVGINVGANKASVDAGTALNDYVSVTWELAGYGHYISVNVSSPNTARLRELQGKGALARLVEEVTYVRNTKAPNKPVLVKIAPDLSWAEVDDILEVITGLEVSGIIATNTTVQRPETLKSSRKVETGGLSGRPLAARSTEIIRYIYQRTEGKLPIIGVGGVFTWQDVLEKILAGASLVQTYTGFVYEGPWMARRVCKGLATYLDSEGIGSIQEIVGSQN